MGTFYNSVWRKIQRRKQEMKRQIVREMAGAGGQLLLCLLWGYRSSPDVWGGEGEIEQKDMSDWKLRGLLPGWTQCLVFLWPAHCNMVSSGSYWQEFPCHRLRRGTSGLMRNRIHNHLKRQKANSKEKWNTGTIANQSVSDCVIPLFSGCIYRRSGLGRLFFLFWQ